MNQVYVHGIGLAAPGLATWPDAQAVLRGESPYSPEPLPPFRTAQLPRNEARRMGAAVKLAFRVAEQACNPAEADSMACVFASADADLTIADRNCTAITSPERAISPTQFHNSVHNAAAGYWSIATGSRGPANSLSAGADTFAVALCDAWAMLATDAGPVLLVCFDAMGSGLLQAARGKLHNSFASALLLSSQPAGALARLSGLAHSPEAATVMDDPALDRFRECNAAARALPLLTALAGNPDQTVVLQSGQGNLKVEVQCPP